MQPLTDQQRIEQAKHAIVHHATECESALRLADFADGEACFPSAMGEGLRKLAAYHSEHAFAWVPRLSLQAVAA